MGTIYDHITAVKRNVIQSQHVIALTPGRSKSTISREIRRNRLKPMEIIKFLRKRNGPAQGSGQEAEKSLSL